MVSGTPDYYQTVRQTYGAAQILSGGVNVVASVVTELGIVYGKGMIYGGVIYIDEALSQKNSKALMFVDGVQLNIISMLDLNKRNISREDQQPIYITQYNEVNYQYTVCLSQGITFESSFKISYDEEHGDTPSVGFEVFYALV